MAGFRLIVGDKSGYLPEHPAALIRPRNKYPTIAGVTKDAGAFIMSRKFISYYSKGTEERVRAA